jgi:hypothetical protein
MEETKAMIGRGREIATKRKGGKETTERKLKQAWKRLKRRWRT